MTVLVIKSSEWMRGTGETSGKLLDSKTNTRCCVGIRAKQLGIPDKDIFNVPWPGQSEVPFSKVLKADQEGRTLTEEEALLLHYYDEWREGKNAAEINDARTWGELKGLVNGFKVKEQVTTIQGIHEDSDPISDEDRIELLRPIFEDKGIQLDWRPNE